MPAAHDLAITVREVVPHGDELKDHTAILHGQAPSPEGETQDFHLAISSTGSRLLLFREGHLPQALNVSELVSEWLMKANASRRLRIGSISVEAWDEERRGGPPDDIVDGPETPPEP